MPADSAGPHEFRERGELWSAAISTALAFFGSLARKKKKTKAAKTAALQSPSLPSTLPPGAGGRMMIDVAVHGPRVTKVQKDRDDGCAVT